jgi:hypothetical protein
MMLYSFDILHYGEKTEKLVKFVAGNSVKAFGIYASISNAYFVVK